MNRSGPVVLAALLFGASAGEHTVLAQPAAKAPPAAKSSSATRHNCVFHCLLLTIRFRAAVLTRAPAILSLAGIYLRRAI